MNKNNFSAYIKSFDFKNLFIELGWDNFSNTLPVAVDNTPFELQGIAEKRGFVILLCQPDEKGDIPLSAVRKKIEHHITRLHQEHLLIYADKSKSRQIWQFVIQEKDKPKRVREIPYNTAQDPEALYQRARGLLFTLDEEEKITLVDVTARFKESFGKNIEKVTKKFYTEFKKQHTAFLDFIEGIDDTFKDNKNKQWYASLMLNRLMFCYFIQKRGYLDKDINYLQNKLKEVKKKAGENSFYSFYREFLLKLFHQGLGLPAKERKLSVDLGKIPYLNGGIFDKHQLEQRFSDIKIQDDAFEKIFNFFDQWNWTLDIRPDASGKEINPDVIGYIFEKYINDRTAMGAYYTKEDITDYIGKNTIIPFLFDKVKKTYPRAFDKNGFIRTYLKSSGDFYIYDAVKKGIPQEGGLFDDLPEYIKKGFNPKLEKKIVDGTAPHLCDIRKPWNRKAPSEIALPTEIYRELIERRKRYGEIKEKIEKGEITGINDFITFNLNIRQFAQYILENTEDPDLIRHFFKAIRSVTVLDPTYGSGAFLFAALNILEPLYEACIERMEQFTAEEPRKYKFFHKVLTEVNSEEHPNLQYYIYKSIILNNIYGVDIMVESVEIAKLRLFLKMVGAVGMDVGKPNFGLEPLPDIDFNIRAGNTLVGFATEKEFKNAIETREPLFAPKIIEDFEEEFGIVATAYKHFHDSQLVTDKGTESHRKAKQELQRRFDELNDSLNDYLASTYGIDKKTKQKKYGKWLESHQPFHWFAEFYEIIKDNGGFDVVIGNPPYVEYKNKINYDLINFKTAPCNNLYAFVLEKNSFIINPLGISGMIIPHSAFCTDRMSEVMNLFKKGSVWVSSYDIRPSKLFNGVDQRLAIYIHKEKVVTMRVTTRYHRWPNELRPFSFHSLVFGIDLMNQYKNAFIKAATRIDKDILNKISKDKMLSYYMVGQQKVYYHNAPRYWVRAMAKPPYFWNEKNGEHVSSQIKSFSIQENIFVILTLNSNLFYWWYLFFSDSRHLNNREIECFPLKIDEISTEVKKNLDDLKKKLFKSYEKNKVRKECYYQATGNVKYDEYYPKQSKHIIDEIDKVLAKHYGFTEEELDYIINYDIKYRMGKELFAENNGKTEGG